MLLISPSHPDRVVVWLIRGIFNPYTILVLEPHRENCLWKPPSGNIEWGEQPILAGIRETREETGIILEPKELFPLAKIWKSRKHYHIHYYIAGLGLRHLRQLRRQGETGERTIRYPLVRLPYQLDTQLKPGERPLLRGKSVLADDLEFLQGWRKGQFIQQTRSGFRYEPKLVAA